MGGCKCTYKNCTVKSDGKTHLFHYPVFNKIRCHQWIINAQRYELLDLKVSQLKNRVICQYHFKDEDFMNCQNAKLTKDAIPTLDGPFCDSKKWNKEHNYASGLPLITEDIENEDLPYEEKVKNYSIKYADFLTNFEPELLSGTNFDPCNLNHQDNVIVGTIKCSKQLAFQSNNDIVERELDEIKIEPDKGIKLQEMIIDNNPVLCEDKSFLQNPLLVTEEMPSTINNKKENFNEPKITNCQAAINNSISTTPNKNNIKNTKIKILSEKKIKNAIKFPNDLQPVPPSILITLPRYKNKSDSNNSEKHTNVSLNINLRDTETTSTCPTLNVEKQEEKKLEYSLQYKTPENVQPMYSLDLNCLKYDQPSLYTLQVNQSQGNNQPTSSASLITTDFQNIVQSTSSTGKNKVQPLYTIDSNGLKQKCLPSISFDTDGDKQNTQSKLNPVAIDLNKYKSVIDQYLLNNVLPNDNDEEKQSVIKVLEDKYTVEVEIDPKEEKKCDKTPEQPNSKLNELYIMNNNKGMSQLKSRMSPNRLAKIEEKRTFNKKLVDACLELEKSLQQKTPKQKFVKLLKCQKPQQDNSNFSNKKNIKHVTSYLSEDPKQPSIDEYTLKFLDDRLLQMENRLLNKLVQSTQEMKESLKPQLKQKTASVQTNLDGNQESYKRHLYREISQFLRPNCRSAVYEELFINKFSLDNNKDDNYSSVLKNKRRRCR